MKSEKPLPVPLAAETIIRQNIDGYALLAPCENPQQPNPAGAAAIVEAISELIGIEVDISGLMFQANRLKQTFDTLARQTHQIQRFSGIKKPKDGLYR